MDLTFESVPEGGISTVVTGDWRNFYAAAMVSVPRVQAAILSREDPEDGRTVVELTTIRELPGRLTAERLGPPSDKPQSIRLTAHIGLIFEDRKAEERLLNAVAGRLHDLAGREFAPLDE
jgi:hypothetical protein